LVVATLAAAGAGCGARDFEAGATDEMGGAELDAAAVTAGEGAGF
jgi:hypothetical protein